MTDDMTVAEIEQVAAQTDDPDVLAELHEAEAAGKDRVTALDAIEERLDELTPDPDAEDDPDDAEPEPTGHINVKAAPGHAGHVAGYSFAVDEVKRVPADGKVKKALMRGQLQRVA